MPRTCANRFRQIGYRHVEDEQPVPIEETLAALTALAQLEQDLAADALRLSPQIMDELEQIQRRQPNPAG
mgnify:CR=1 FL=1